MFKNPDYVNLLLTITITRKYRTPRILKSFTVKNILANVSTKIKASYNCVIAFSMISFIGK